MKSVRKEPLSGRVTFLTMHKGQKHFSDVIHLWDAEFQQDLSCLMSYADILVLIKYTQGLKYLL